MPYSLRRVMVVEQCHVIGRGGGGKISVGSDGAGTERTRARAPATRRGSRHLGSGLVGSFRPNLWAATSGSPKLRHLTPVRGGRPPRFPWRWFGFRHLMRACDPPSW